jgi:hypothetical protein
MVHIEEAQEIEEPVKTTAEHLYIFHGGGILWEDGSQNGGQCQEDEEEYAELHRAEKVPEDGYWCRFPVSLLHFSSQLFRGGITQLPEFFNILCILVSRKKGRIP